MTYRDRLKQEHPDCLSDRFDGGCDGCPEDYGYPDDIACMFNCTACWNRECPGTVQEAPGAAENVLKIKLDPGAIMPTRAHSTDAGLDLYSRESFTLMPGMSRKCDTGVHVAIPKGYGGLLVSKSGLNVNHGITSEGLIDSGYTGSIMVKLYNQGRNPVLIEQGQKISQLVILPIVTPFLLMVDSLEETERGNGGFGSTGKF